MRSFWKLLACVGAALLLAATATAQSPVAPAAARKVVAQQVSPSAWFVQGDAAIGSPTNRNFVSNAGFIVTSAGVVVVDALGSPQLARELLDQIATVTSRPVTHVLVTHFHADHIYGLQEFKKRGARILAQRRALEYIHSDTAAARDMEPFDEAYARVNWSRFEHLPLFRAANRMNAYNTYLLMERQAR